jgi:uncharacterized protein (DUF1778 family)
MATYTERLDMRLTPEHKSLMEQAGSLKELSLSSWVKSVALTEAREAIEAHNRTTLSRRDWEKFLEIVDSDDAPAPALKRAVARHKKIRVAD